MKTQSTQIIPQQDIDKEEFKEFLKQKLAEKLQKQEVTVRQYQVIQKKHGFFGRSTEIIFKPEAFKDPAMIGKDSDRWDEKHGKPFFRSTKVTNITIHGNGNQNIFKF